MRRVMNLLLVKYFLERIALNIHHTHPVPIFSLGKYNLWKTKVPKKKRVKYERNAFSFKGFDLIDPRNKAFVSPSRWYLMSPISCASLCPHGSFILTTFLPPIFILSYSLWQVIAQKTFYLANIKYSLLHLQCVFWHTGRKRNRTWELQVHRSGQFFYHDYWG